MNEYREEIEGLAEFVLAPHDSLVERSEQTRPYGQERTDFEVVRVYRNELAGGEHVSSPLTCGVAYSEARAHFSEITAFIELMASDEELSDAEAEVTPERQAAIANWVRALSELEAHHPIVPPRAKNPRRVPCSARSRLCPTRRL